MTPQSSATTSILFDRYPRQLLGRINISPRVNIINLRRFMRTTKQTACAYCGLDLLARYEDWERWEVDHVIPVSLSLRLGIPEEWYDDFSNSVPACSICNRLCTKYKPTFQVATPKTLIEFFELRDRIFEERKALVIERRKQRMETWMESRNAIKEFLNCE